jgi:hypothetical protein
VLAGEDAVKAGGEKYLPRLDSQADDDFKAYKQRAAFFNATARTADGFLGLIFRRDPTVKIPKDGSGVARALAAFCEDADLQGTSMSSKLNSWIARFCSSGFASRHQTMSAKSICIAANWSSVISS